MIVLALAVLCSTAMAEVNSFGYVGGTYNAAIKGFSSEVGCATRVAPGSRIWAIGRSSIGPSQTALQPELGAFWNLRGWRAGLFAAPGVVWQGLPEENVTTYLTGSIGGCGGYINEKTNVGFIVGGLFRSDGKVSTGFHDGWEGFATLVFKL
jgi:hypothetical protein